MSIQNIYYLLSAGGVRRLMRYSSSCSGVTGGCRPCPGTVQVDLCPGASWGTESGKQCQGRVYSWLSSSGTGGLELAALTQGLAVSGDIP